MDEEKKLKKRKKLEKEKLKQELQTKNRMLTLTIVVSILFVITIILYESFGNKRTVLVTGERDKNRNVNIKVLVEDKLINRNINYLKFNEIPNNSDIVFAISKEDNDLFSYKYSDFSNKILDKDYYYLLGYYTCNDKETCEVIENSNYHYESTILDGKSILRYNYLDNISETIDIDSGDFGYLKYFEDNNKIYGYIYNNLENDLDYFVDLDKNHIAKTFDNREIYEVKPLDLENNLVYVVNNYEYNDLELGYRKAPLNSLTVYNFKTWEVVKKLDNNYNLEKIVLGSNIYYVGYSDIDYYYNDNGSYNTYIYNSKFERINDTQFYHFVVNSDNTISFMDYSENIIKEKDTKELVNYYYTYSTYDSNFKLINEISSINSKTFAPILLKDYLLGSELDSVNKDSTTNNVILISTNGEKKKNIFTLKDNQVLNGAKNKKVNDKNCIIIDVDDSIEEQTIYYYYYLDKDKLNIEKTKYGEEND